MALSQEPGTAWRLVSTGKPAIWYRSGYTMGQIAFHQQEKQPSQIGFIQSQDGPWWEIHDSLTGELLGFFVTKRVTEVDPFIVGKIMNIYQQPQAA